MSNKSQILNSPHLISGINHHRAGEIQEAQACYEAAIKNDEKNFEAWHMLGVIAAQKDQPTQAIKLIIHSLALQSENSKAYNNLGLIQASINQFEEAISSYDSAIALNPNYWEAFNNRGNAQQSLFKFEEAISSYDSAIALNPNYADAWYNKGTLFQSLKRYDDALDCYDQTKKLEPSFADCLNNAGDIYNELGLQEKSREFYEATLATQPSHLPARIGLALSSIPKIFTRHQSLQACRDELVIGLSNLHNWVHQNNPKDGFNAVGIHQPFFLAYQDRNNKALLKQYGSVNHHLMRPLQAMVDTYSTQSQPSSGKIRIGIVSNHFNNHSVWNAISKGFVQQIDKTRFEIHLFSIDSKTDSETVIAKDHSNSFTENIKTIEGWIESILNKNIEVLLFPEIGMDKTTFQLANLKLAPIQIAAWGHPETTGLSTIDYYLSAELFETIDSPSNYAEKLITLANLGCYFEPRNNPSQLINLAEIGLDHARPILISPGSPFKYSPDYDDVITSIARKLPNAQIVFFTFPFSSIEIFKERLMSKFSSEGLYFDHSIKFIPLLEVPSFKGLMKKADLFIDTIGFSGFNTAMQAIECNLPIVTREGNFMRGNLASGILKRIGLTDLITRDSNSYVELITKLIQCPELIHQYSQKINATKHVLFSDLKPIREFEKFLLRECRNSFQ